MSVETRVGDVPARRSRRLLLGWSASSVPIAPLLLLGMGLGPQALSVLSEGALAALDPATPVALAALGVLVGLDVDAGRSRAPLLMTAGAWHALLTTGLVAAGLFAALRLGLWPSAMPWLIPAVCGVCAASSLTLPGRPASEPRRATDALMEAEVSVTVVLGALVLLALTRDSVAAAALLLLQGLGLVALLAIAGWLLVRRAASVTERRVFATATLLLVGGAADFLASSALLAGFAAALCWNRIGETSRSLQAETLHLQHPLVVLVLLVAGARTEFSPLTMGLAAAYVSLRAMARFVGGRLLTRVLGGGTGDLHLQLVAPGVFGVAFALNVERVVGIEAAGAPTPLSIVVIGTVLSDVIARLVASRGARA
jgi:hypothetical protein